MIKKGLIATLIATLIMSAMTIWTINTLPETGDIPVHWNYKGEADRFEPVANAKRILWLLPGLSVFTSLILALGIKIDPRNKNIQRSGRAYMAIWLGTLVLMVFVTALVCYAMITGASSPDAKLDVMPELIVGGLSVLLLIMGNYLPKSRSNWFFGIRTPWTLSSDESWEKTHRIAGRLFIGLGITGFISALVLPTTWQIPVIVAGSLSITVFSLIYSYLAWRNASDRVTTPEYVE